MWKQWGSASFNGEGKGERMEVGEEREEAGASAYIQIQEYTSKNTLSKYRSKNTDPRRRAKVREWS